jgi:hypothetical protein
VVETLQQHQKQRVVLALFCTRVIRVFTGDGNVGRSFRSRSVCAVRVRGIRRRRLKRSPRQHAQHAEKRLEQRFDDRLQLGRRRFFRLARVLEVLVRLQKRVHRGERVGGAHARRLLAHHQVGLLHGAAQRREQIRPPLRARHILGDHDAKRLGEQTHDRAGGRRHEKALEDGGANGLAFARDELVRPTRARVVVQRRRRGHSHEERAGISLAVGTRRGAGDAAEQRGGEAGLV